MVLAAKNGSIMRLAVDIFAGLGAWCLASFFAVGAYAMLVDHWRERAVETTRPGASSTAKDGRTLGLVAPLSDREQPQDTPPSMLGRPTRSDSTPKVSRPLGH
jgi:hypothetical protein